MNMKTYIVTDETDKEIIATYDNHFEVTEFRQSYEFMVEHETHCYFGSALNNLLALGYSINLD